MNVRYRVELSQSERSELTALLSGGKQAARKLKRAQIWPPMPEPVTMRSQGASPAVRARRRGQCVCADGRPPCEGACCSLDEVCSSGRCGVPCGGLQESRGAAPCMKNDQLGNTAGWFKFFWNTFAVPDRIIVTSQESSPWDTGCVGSMTSPYVVRLWHSGASSVIQVQAYTELLRHTQHRLGISDHLPDLCV